MSEQAVEQATTDVEADLVLPVPADGHVHEAYDEESMVPVEARVDGAVIRPCPGCGLDAWYVRADRDGEDEGEPVDGS